jgi:hypothetical protein
MKLRALSDCQLETGTNLPAKLFLTGVEKPVKIADISISRVDDDYEFELREADLMRLRLIARDLSTTYVLIDNDEESPFVKFMDEGKKRDDLLSVAEQLKKRI